MTSQEGAICEKLYSLIDKFETLPGTKIFRMLKRFEISQYVVNKNYQELYSFIANFEENSAWNRQNDEEKTIFFKEISRLLHNYLSSTFSLISHNRKFIKDLENPKFQKEYDTKIKVLTSNDCHGFIVKLRNIIQHVELPLLWASFSRQIEDKQTKQSILLDEKKLRSKNLRDDSRESKPGFEKNIFSDQEIDLKVAIERYQTLINDFYKWFFQRVEQLYSKDFEKYHAIEKEIHILLSELFQKNV